MAARVRLRCPHRFVTARAQAEEPAQGADGKVADQRGDLVVDVELDANRRLPATTVERLFDLSAPGLVRLDGVTAHMPIYPEDGAEPHYTVERVLFFFFFFFFWWDIRCDWLGPDVGWSSTSVNNPSQPCQDITISDSGQGSLDSIGGDDGDDDGLVIVDWARASDGEATPPDEGDGNQLDVRPSAVAVAAYDPVHDGDLALVKGDLVTNVRETEDPLWLRGTVDDRRGFFPAVLVMLLRPSTPM